MHFPRLKFDWPASVTNYSWQGEAKGSLTGSLGLKSKEPGIPQKGFINKNRTANGCWEAKKQQMSTTAWDMTLLQGPSSFGSHFHVVLSASPRERSLACKTQI